ncbi:heavy metal translocating P-type ATPase [Modicisalibacter coralii]|uniref:heavy metal translocating P-type ATPase n=1 Tax=Modicisalibacter coralii TaxID=2304602 RepID=UPI00100BA5FE|nr:heavy metal translocating P-type ATPase [Halomonas coralii]
MTAATATPCYHCGGAVPVGAAWHLVLDDTHHPLCCPGCEAVARAIVDGGLASYYRFRDRLPERPDAGPAARAETWQVFDDPQLQADFVHPLDETGARVSATLAVDGITCAACAWLIEHRLDALDGLERSAVDLSHHRLHLQWDRRQLPLSRILAELAAIGYPSQPYAPDEAQRRLQRDERRLIRRLIVAAVAMMQVAMFSIPFYVAGEGGIGASFQGLFHALSLMLATVVVGYCAQPFLRGAWRDLRSRHPGMDVPVSLAILGAYLASAWAVLTGGGEVYFDSLSMFTFFLLFSRYLERRARQRHGRSGNALAGVLPSSALRLDADGGERIVPADRLEPGDRVRVTPGGGIPADGVIVTGTSRLDEAMLTGESQPVRRGPGESATGGSLNVDSPLIIEVVRRGRDSRAAGILALADRAFAERSPVAERSARLARGVVLGVLLIAGVVAGAWSLVDPGRALWVTLSVLVVTCPCALALAMPAALTACHGRLKRRGVLITRAPAIDDLARISRVVFDKTGTLTEGRLRLCETVALGAAVDGERSRALAAALEAHSEHPIAGAFAAWRDASLTATEVINHPGCGLEGWIGDRRYRLGRADFVLDAPPSPPSPDGQWLLLAGAGTALAWFRLDDRLREDAAATVAALKRAGLGVELLSGDARQTVAALAERVGVEAWTAGATPEGKLAHLRALQARGERILMVGDGINDVPVLAAADVSLAMNSATDLARTRADGVLLSPRLWRLVDAVELARATRRVIRQNLAWALGYNLCALPLAALGWVPPWAAALGMSASSLLVVGNALRLGRSAPQAVPPAEAEASP